MSVRPRRLGYAGTVEAVGVVLARAALPEATCRARVLEAWHAGARLYECGDSWLLFFGAARRIELRRSPGVPLVAHGELISSCPLSKAERAALPARGLVLARGGALECVDRADLKEVDPAEWLDVSAYVCLPVEPLRGPPTPVVDLPVAPEPEVAGALIGKLGAAPSARDELRRALGSLAERPPAGGGGAAAPGEGLSLTDAEPRPPGWFRRLLDRSPWSRVIGRQHARYLREMAKMFERGDYDRALLHAIPAGEIGAAAKKAALGRLGPRDKLSIEPHRAGASTSVTLNDDSYAYMQQLYRNAFEQLQREGRIDEAAYVLLELLGQTEEGVVFLDEHGRSELAAEIAEARGLAPGLVVRLWFRARQPARAVRFARRTGAFADAVVRLQRTDPEAANKLRLLWADYAASAGDYAVAVEAAWPVAEARRLALAWIDRGIEAGGPSGARMLVKKLEVVPEQAELVMHRAREVMADASPASQHVRTALADAVSGASRSDAQIALGSMVARGLVRDAAATGRDELRSLLASVRAHHVEGVLDVDVPAIAATPQVELSHRSELELIRLEADDVGAVAVADAAWLPNGRMLVALGEIGLQLRGRSGRVITHFDCPAHRLVVADNGSQVIAVAPRAGSLLLTRIDVARRKAEAWADLELTGFCSSISGARWFVAHHDEVMALDTTTSPPEVLWRVAERDWTVMELASDDKTVTIWWRRPDGASELWTYASSGLQMVSRLELEHAPGGVVRAVLSPAGDVCTTMVVGDREDQVATRLFTAGSRRMELSADLGNSCLPRSMSNRWLVTNTNVHDRLVLQLIDVGAGRPRLSIALEGSEQCAVRLANRTLTVCDGRGRVLVLSTETGERLRDLRITL